MRLMAGVAALFLVTAACGSGDDQVASSVASDPGGSDRTLRVAHVLAPTFPIQECGLDPMAEELAAGDSGLTLEIFPSAQLGGEKETFGQVIAGELDITFAAPSILADVNPELYVLEAAYMFEGMDDLLEFVRSPAGEAMFEPVTQAGARVVDVWMYGVRHVFGNRPVRTPDDMAGLKIRVPETEVSLANAEAMGASPTPIAFSELFLALQQGVVDAAEAPAAATQSEGFGEAADYYSLTAHQVTSFPMLINEGVWTSLREEQQSALSELAAKYGAEVVDCIKERDEQALDEWRASGELEIVDDVDRAAFRERVDDEYASGYPWSDMYAEIRRG